MQRWHAQGVFEAIWAHLVRECDDLGGVLFEWQSADAALGKLAAAVMRLDATPPTAEKWG